jgi:diguanylate cyclase (GGDEF)-like protein
MWPTNLEFRTKVAAHRFEQLKKLVDSLDVLPCTPRVPIRILELHRDGATLGEFADAVMSDPALAVTAVAMANRAFPQAAVVGVNEAVKLIGVNKLMPFLFGASLAGIHSRADLPPSQRDGLWKATLFKAMVARHFTIAHAPQLGEVAFLCGLLQDMAIPVMLACDLSASTEFMLAIDQESPAGASRERDLFGLSHGQVGRIIAGKLGLPPIYAAALAGHHDATGAALPAEYQKLSTGLKLAATLPHFVNGDTPSFSARFLQLLTAEQPDAVANVKAIKEVLIKEFYHVIANLGGKTAATDNGKFRAFMQDVCDNVARTISREINESVRIVSRLESRIGELENKATADVDPLTGLLNREGFIDRASHLFKLSSEIQSHLGIGFVDVDDFAAINQQHGQPAGDAALRALSRSLKDAVGRRGIAARLGGDKFAFLIVAEPGTSPADATQSVQNVLRQQTCKVGDKMFAVSFSCGVQWLGVPSSEADCAAEILRADQLVRAIKKAGKNRCIIQPAATRLAA